ncbi:MAG: hypothetical protein KAU21_21545, partial [Gammaproteobacteria bacterium]|nr:hypothetical protein [Gammaproteobacteria bacterium]
KAESKEETIKEYLNAIINSGDRLMLFLNNLLDISRMEAGYSELYMHEADMSELTQNCLGTFKVDLDEKKIDVQIDDDFNNKTVVFDQKMIQQVVINLIGNAVKFSHDNSTINISITDDVINLNDGDSVPAIHFKIINTGVSVPEAELEKIFEKFMQSSATNTGAGGTGLGLSISKSIIKAHKGRIWAENLLDDSVAFHFIIPVMPSYAEAKVVS